MRRSGRYTHTVRASSIGYIIQSMVNTFAPLLFVTFQNTYEITLSQVSILIAANFAAQIVFDFIASAFADRIGYRPCIVGAHIMMAVGVSGLAYFPEIAHDPFRGLIVAVLIYGAGGGLTEVLLTPIVQACPIKRKDKAISALHSFYCWGSVLVILISTFFFSAFGISNWKLLAILWAILPIANAVYFLLVPMYEFVPGESRMGMRDLSKQTVFWLIMILMFCAGSAEMAMAQWASSFAEEGLRLSKTAGDIAGPCLFGAMKGIERTWYARRGKESRLWGFMLFCSILCGGCYLVVGASGAAAPALIFCAVAGFSNGVMWPGTFTQAEKALPLGGTALFGMMALAGDVGCGAGPVITGFISAAFGDNLHVGFLFGALFSLLSLCALIIMRKKMRSAP